MNAGTAQVGLNTGESGEIKIILSFGDRTLNDRAFRQNCVRKVEPENWIDIGILAEDEWEYVVRDLVVFPNGRIGGFRRNINRKKLEGGTGAIIMPVQGDKVLLLKHYRHKSREWFWEFPRGWGTPGFTAEENAKKELLEEVGLLPQKLVQVWRDPATVFFYAEMQRGEPHQQDDEPIQKIELFTIKELDDLISSSKITDWFTILTYLTAKNNGCFSL